MKYVFISNRFYDPKIFFKIHTLTLKELCQGNIYLPRNIEPYCFNELRINLKNQIIENGKKWVAIFWCNIKDRSHIILAIKEILWQLKAFSWKS